MKLKLTAFNFSVFVFCITPVIGQEIKFKSVSSDQTHIKFENKIVESESANVAVYDYFYNGGGVGIGDINNDGLSDIFFTGNQTEDALYLNKGNLEFENITTSAGISNGGWSTGVCLFDVNQDGFIDIYVCKSGWHEDTEQLKNKLFVNQGNNTFKEEAKQYGLDIATHSTQAAPLDFDLDGDLDLYIAGHPGRFKHQDDFAAVLKAIDNGEVEGDVLLENRNGVFVDVTEKAGIREYGYTLGIGISDVNQDGYPDIALCNDFDEPDHLFVNQKNGTFKDEAVSYYKHTSNYSMGNDFGDFNNDGLMDYISVDMAFETHERSKMNMASMNPVKFGARVKLGWNYQYMHNMLQLNSGTGNYQEISYLSGIAKTDWSWAPLFMDMNGDGLQDLFVSNGYKRDTKNNDIEHVINEALKEKKELSTLEAIALIPKVKVANFFYLNNGDLSFSDKRSRSGISEKVNTNGVAYADLDNDGDLDLVLNNVDTLASIYENLNAQEDRYLTIDFTGLTHNHFFGSFFELETTRTHQFKEAYFIRGYQSSVEQKIHFYWDEKDQPMVLSVKLNDGRRFDLPLPKKGGVVRLKKIKLEKLESTPLENKKEGIYFKDVAETYGLILSHNENEYDDFENESLLPHKMSSQGPAIAVADINNDGLDDMLVGASVGQITSIILQQENHRFAKMTAYSFYNHQMSEDGGICVFDVNGDKKQDLLISSGGYQYKTGDSSYVNRLYVGNGQGNFGYVKNALPFNPQNSGKVIPFDFEGDGDTDFFICGAASPASYPNASKSALYINNKGFFSDQITYLAPELEYAGIINDAVISDYDQDGDNDLIVVGEWMDVTFFKFGEGKLRKDDNTLGMEGWWTTIEAVDIDQDGDDDYLLGNVGLNNKYRSDKGKHLNIYLTDFDDNGSKDIVLANEENGLEVPVRGKECSTGQMPFLEQKFPTYASFATSTLSEIYTDEKLDAAIHYELNESRSGILYNLGTDKGFSFEPFSKEGQFSFLTDFEVIDINKDGLLDILAIGNRFDTEVETTRYDANNGVCYLQDKSGNFNFIPAHLSGFIVPNDARSMRLIQLGTEKYQAVVVTNNNGKVQFFQLK